MGDASSVRLAIVEETTFGTNPGSGFSLLRFNNESLRYDQQQIQSGQIDPTRQPSANIRVSVNAAGNIVCEDSLVTPAATPAGFDMLIEGAMMNDFSTIVAATTKTIDIGTPSGGVFAVTDTGLGASFANVSVGDWIKIGGLTTNTAGSIYCRVVTKTDSNNITAEGVQSNGAAVVAETGSGNETVDGSTVKIGTTKKSYTIERQYTDLSVPEYSLYLGMRVSRWSLSLTPQAIFQHTFEFLGKSQGTTTSSGAGTPTAVWATPICEAVDHFKMKMLGGFGALSTERISRIDFTVDNGLRQEPELGVLGSTDIGISTPRVNGTVVVYMTNADLIRLTEAGTRSKLAFRIDDGTRARIISFNSVLFGTPEQGARGNDQSVEVSLPFSCEADSDGIAMTVSRF